MNDVFADPLRRNKALDTGMRNRDLVHLPEWTFYRKRISANSNPNTKAQKSFLENEMTSFFGQVSKYRAISMADRAVTAH